MGYLAFKKQAHDDIYSPDMSSEDKWRTFNKDVRRAARSQVRTSGIVTDYLKDTFDRQVDFALKMTPYDFIGGIKTWLNNDDPNNRVNKRIAKATMSQPVLDAADRFVDASTPEDMSHYLKAHSDDAISTGPNAPYEAAIANYTADRMKSSIWSHIKANPIKNIPIATSMWLRQKGLNGIANFAENPLAFYSSLAAALFLAGSAFTGDDDEETASEKPSSYDARLYRDPYVRR